MAFLKTFAMAVLEDALSGMHRDIGLVFSCGEDDVEAHDSTLAPDMKEITTKIQTTSHYTDLSYVMKRAGEWQSRSKTALLNQYTLVN